MRRLPVLLFVLFGFLPGVAGAASAPAVAVVAVTASQPPGASGTATFSVSNGNADSRSYTLVATSSDTGVMLDPADPGPITVAAGGKVNVPVTVRVSATAPIGSTATVTLRATDSGDPAATGSGSFTHTTVEPRPQLTLTSVTPSLPAGSSGWARFDLKNPSTNAHGYRLVATSTDTAVVPDPADPAQVQVAAGGTVSVLVSYSVAASAAVGSKTTVRLEAIDVDASSRTSGAWFTHTTAAASLVAPSVQVVSAPASRPAGATATATFSVGNGNGSSRTYTLAATSSNTGVVPDPADPAQITVAAGQSQQVVVTYQVASSAAGGSTANVTLKATDSSDSTRLGSASFTHTTEAAQATLQNPEVRVVTSTASLPAGSTATATYSVRNQNSSQRTYNLEALSLNSAVVADPADPAAVTLAGGETKHVTVTYSVLATAAASSTAIVRLRAVDSLDAAKAHHNGFTHTTAAAAAPSVAVVSSTATLTPGASGSAVFSVTNNNAAGTQSFVFAATSTSTAVVPDPADPVTIAIVAGRAAQVTVTYQVSASAAAGSTSTIRLKASDAAAPAKNHTAGFTHTTGALLAPPAVSFPDGWRHGLRGVTYSVRMDVTNQSNQTRTLCFAGSREPGYGGDANNVTTGNPAVPPCQSFTAGETKTLPVSYTMANSDWDGDGIMAVVTASDQAQPSVSTQAKFKVSVQMAAEAPAPAALQAGKPYTYTWRFYNRDRFGTAHTYNVTHAISGAAVFQNVSLPARITIPAGQWGTVSVAFTVPASLAGQSGALAVTLQDVDPNWPERLGTAISSVTAVDVLAPSVSLPDGWTHGLRKQSYVARLVVKNNTAAPRTLCFSSRRAPGSGGTPNTVTTGDPTVPPCQSFEAAETKTLQIGYTMADSDWDGDGVQAYVTSYDRDDPSRAAEAWTKISVLMNTQAPAHAALQAGRSYTYTYRFFNQDRFGTQHTYTVTHDAAALFQSVSHPASVTIPAGAWGTVDVSFTLPAGSAGQTGALEVQLKDVDPSWPDRIGRALATVASIDVLPPSLELPDGWRHGLRGQSYSVRLVVTNNTDAPRTLCFSSRRAPGSGGTPDTVTTGNPSVPPCQAFGANETRTLQVGYTMAASDWDGDGIQAYITAWDQQDSAKIAETWFKISVLMAAEAPAPATLQAGQTYTYPYRFYNQDRFGAQHTYSVTTSVSGDAIFQNVSAPSTVTIAAGAWGVVDVSFTVPAGSAGRAGALAVSLKDTDPSWPDRIGTASASVTSGTVSVANPAVTAPANDTAPPGSQRSAVFTVKNNSSAGRTFSFAASSSNTGVVPDPLDPPSRTIAAGATESVSVQYTVFGSAGAGASASIALSATDAADTTRSGSAAFVVTVANAQVPSDKFTGYSIFPSNFDHPTGIPIQLGGGHLDPRQYRQWIGWQGCAPNYHPNGDPDIAYTPNVPQFAAANPGKLYIFLDEPAHGTVWNHRTSTPTGCKQVTPEQYARAYHAFVQSVRAADPTARFSPAGFEQFRATEESYRTAFIEYAAEFAQKYQENYGTPPPVDEWRFHVYWEWWPDPSDIALWREKANLAIGFANHRGKPVVLGIGYPWQGYDARMLDGMSNMFAYLKDHSGVASVFWFSYDEFHDGENRLTTHTEGGGATRTLTTLGERYLSLIRGLGNPSTGSPVSVTPDSMNAYVPAGAPGSQKFLVQNLGAGTATYTLTRSCSEAVTNCGAPNPAQVTLSPGQAPVEVSVSYSMAASGSGTLTLNAVQSGVPGVNDSGSYRLTATSATQGTFDLSVHNGENVSLAQFAATLSYTTPAYISMDQPRAATLYYASSQAAPTGFVQVEVDDATPPQQYSILVERNGAALSAENFYEGGTGGKSILAAQFDASALGGTGAYTVDVVVRRWNGGQATSSRQSARVLVVDERNSPYGAGWSIGGLQRLHVQPDGVLVTSGDGTAVFYAKPQSCAGSCVFTRPAAEWTDLEWNGTQYVRRYRDGGTAVFHGSGLLAYRADRWGNRTDYGYDTAGRLLYIEDPVKSPYVSSRITFDYTGGRLSAIRDPGSRTTAVTIDAAGNLVQITDPESITALRPDYTGHRLKGWTDRLGSRWDVTYDRAGMLASTIAPSAEVIVAGQPVVHRPESKNESVAAATLPLANGGTAASPSPRVTSPARISVTDPLGNTTRVTVNRFGHTIATVNALGQSTTIDRDASSLVTRIVEPSGHVTHHTWYDGTPLLKSTRNETTNSIVHYEYTDYDQPLKVYGTVPEVTYKYDPSARPTAIETRRADGSLATRQMTLGPDGRIILERDPGGHATSYQYTDPESLEGNPRRNLYSAGSGGEDGNLRVTAYFHDAYGRVTDVTIPSDGTTPPRTSSVQYDGLNRVITAWDAQRNATRTSYEEGSGRMTVKVTDAKSNVHTRVSNALGWQESETDPRGRTRRYGYDKAGNLAESINRRGQRVSMTYDALNRLKSQTDLATGAVTTWDYDNTAGSWTKVSNAESTNLFSFDPAGRLLSEQVTVGGATYSIASVYQHATFPLRTALNVTLPGGATRSTAYELGYNGVVNAITDFGGAVTTIARNADGGVEAIRYPPNVSALSETTSHHADSEINYYNMNGPLSPDLGAGFTLDVIGRIRAKWNPARTMAFTYNYDPSDRLAEVWRETRPAPSNDCVDQEVGVCLFTGPGAFSHDRIGAFAYDAVGNRTDRNATIDTGNRLASFDGVTMTYDDDGNLLARSSGETYVWSAAGRLLSATVGGATTTFGYDGLGRRVRKTTPAGTIRYLHDGDHVLMELDAAGAPVREYTFLPGIDEPLSVRYGGQNYYYLTESPGHVVALIDGAGQVVETYHYGPWGETALGQSPPYNTLAFAGRQYDAETRLYYNRARYYDPRLGRFLSEDPSGLAGGINLYAYAGNDPVNSTDPYGLEECNGKSRSVIKQLPDGNFEITVICAQGGGGGGGGGAPLPLWPAPQPPQLPPPPSIPIMTGGGAVCTDKPTIKAYTGPTREQWERCRFFQKWDAGWKLFGIFADGFGNRATLRSPVQLSPLGGRSRHAVPDMLSPRTGWVPTTAVDHSSWGVLSTLGAGSQDMGRIPSNYGSVTETMETVACLPFMVYENGEMKMPR